MNANLNKGGLYLQCEANDQDGLIFSIESTDEGPYGYIMTTAARFYSHQYSFWRRFRAAWAILTGKEYRLHELMLSTEDICSMRDYLTEV